MSAAPRRRPTPAVYRRRRLGVLLIVLLVVGGVVGAALWQPWQGWFSQVQETATPASPPPTAPTDQVSEPAETAVASSEVPQPDPATSAAPEEVVACTADQVQVQASTDKDVYAAGELPQLTLVLTNVSARDCILDVGTAAQVFTISSGSDVWWRSTDCQQDPTNQEATLLAGQETRSQVPVVWDRTRSSVSTCDSADRPAAPAGGSSYHLAVTLGGIESARTVQFLLN